MDKDTHVKYKLYRVVKYSVEKGKVVLFKVLKNCA